MLVDREDCSMSECRPCGDAVMDNASRTTTDLCPVVRSFEQIGTRWRWVVLRTLLDGELRFSDLKRATNAPSHTLSRVLDELATHNLTERDVDPGPPIAVRYSLTEKGKELTTLFGFVEIWAEEWVDG